MNPLPSTLGATLAINAKCLLASGFFYASWLCWPTAAQWWGLGAISIMAGMMAASLVVDVLKTMARVHAREKALLAYLAQGRAPKSAEMASPDDLDRAGMR